MHDQVEVDGLLPIVAEVRQTWQLLRVSPKHADFFLFIMN